MKAYNWANLKFMVLIRHFDVIKIAAVRYYALFWEGIPAKRIGSENLQ